MHASSSSYDMHVSSSSNEMHVVKSLFLVGDFVRDKPTTCCVILSQSVCPAQCKTRRKRGRCRHCWRRRGGCRLHAVLLLMWDECIMAKD